jgi:hypothetical protein
MIAWAEMKHQHVLQWAAEFKTAAAVACVAWQSSMIRALL